MSPYRTFIFEAYNFDVATRTLTLKYDYDETLHFTETFTFNFEYAAYDPAVLDRALQNLFFLTGVSYYKAYLAPEIIVNQGSIDAPLAAFLGDTYQQGLGEFFYMNKFDPRTAINFPVNTDIIQPLQNSGNGMLIGLGGGKDSLVSTEALRNTGKVATWSVGHQQQLEPLVERVGLNHLWVERQWDPTLKEHNDKGAYNGHVPISAILAAAGTVTAILSGYRDVVVSNEQSANEPSLEYEGVSINHQYSKSQAFEVAWQEVLAAQFGTSLRYYSLLRPLSELKIAELFAKYALEKYVGVFSSCNRAYRHTSDEMYWCGECPKCAFVYLALANFVPEPTMLEIFSGRNLILEPEMETTYQQLLGIAGDKPLECVGEVRECRAAMDMLQSKYLELTKYKFELDASYDYAQLSPHAMPDKVFKSISPFLTS